MINCNTTNEKPQTKDSPSCNNLLVYIKGQTYPEKNQSQAAPVNPNLKQPTMKFLVTHLNLFTHCIFASTEDIHSIDLSLKKRPRLSLGFLSVPILHRRRDGRENRMSHPTLAIRWNSVRLLSFCYRGTFLLFEPSNTVLLVIRKFFVKKKMILSETTWFRIRVCQYDPTGFEYHVTINEWRDIHIVNWPLNNRY